QISSMEQQHVARDCIPTVVDRTPTSATVRFTKKSVQGLFNDLYAARVGTVESRSKWAGTQLKDVREVEEIDPETKKAQKVKRYVYEVIQPSGRFLRDHYPDEDGPWLKLWRDMLWTIPRGIPQTRIRFNQCAERGSCDEGEAAWEALMKVEEKRRKN